MNAKENDAQFGKEIIEIAKSKLQMIFDVATDNFVIMDLKMILAVSKEFMDKWGLGDKVIFEFEYDHEDNDSARVVYYKGKNTGSTVSYNRQDRILPCEGMTTLEILQKL